MQLSQRVCQLALQLLIAAPGLVSLPLNGLHVGQLLGKDDLVPRQVVRCLPQGHLPLQHPLLSGCQGCVGGRKLPLHRLHLQLGSVPQRRVVLAGRGYSLRRVSLFALPPRLVHQLQVLKGLGRAAGRSFPPALMEGRRIHRAYLHQQVPDFCRDGSSNLLLVRRCEDSIDFLLLPLNLHLQVHVFLPQLVNGPCVCQAGLIGSLEVPLGGRQLLLEDSDFPGQCPGVICGVGATAKRLDELLPLPLANLQPCKQLLPRLRKLLPQKLQLHGTDLLIHDLQIRPHSLVDDGLVSDVPGPVGVFEGVERLLNARVGSADGRHHQSAAVAAKRVLQHPGDLRVAIGNVRSFALFISKRADDISKGQQALVDGDSLLETLPHRVALLHPLAACKVHEVQL
mmetsp:Transcript_16946/g.47298  ORF Transcript_16946/g.47298 Transcript_16946/m.47298 type:complete len:397 (+) Transcript_16946:2734-3924(+)